MFVGDSFGSLASEKLRQLEVVVGIPGQRQMEVRAVRAGGAAQPVLQPAQMPPKALESDGSREAPVKRARHSEAP